jgi:hypothetical protein
MVDVFFGIVWLVCLFGLVVGIFGIGRDTYKESNKSNQESIKVIGIIIVVVLVLTAIGTIT